MAPRDDLIGLLRELDGAMGTLAPPAGHEARLRARLAGAGRKERSARPLVLVLCTAVAALSVWLAWSESKEPVSMPQGPVSVPSASGDVVREPSSAASGTTEAPSPRWLPKPVLPTLPLLPPRSDNAPSPRSSPAPVSPAPSRPLPEITASRPRDGAEPMESALASSRQSSGARSVNDIPKVAWADLPNASPGGVSGGPIKMGGWTSDGHPASVHASQSSHTTSQEAANSPETKPEPEPAPRQPKIEVNAGACQSGLVEAGAKCLPPEDLLEQAALLCKVQGLAPGRVSASPECASIGPGWMSVPCCAPAAPPQKCESVIVGDGTTCLEDVVFKELSLQTCGGMGATPSALGLAYDCDGGKSTMAKVLCCQSGGEPANEPAPPSGAVGDGQTCLPDDELESEAADICEEQGLVVADFWAAEDCSASSSRIAKYVCGK